ncbi:MAG TPA: tRNA (adenosine(37)-N6)-threonylcarbamoyltransferase complex dimerization subunit type 1 TsaB [Pyrinomonadaceae bacterium]
MKRLSVSATQTPLILSIETATRAGSVALTRGDRLLCAREGDASVSHSSHLLRYVSEALEEGGVALGEVELFAAAIGPGSFTGLRIGLATVKSFAATLGRPCVGVPSLYAVARAAGESERTLATLQAGRGEVFAQLVKVDASGDVHPLEEPAHLTPQRLLEKVRTMRHLRWAGEGALAHGEALRALAQSEEIPFSREDANGIEARGGAQGWTLAPPPSILAAEVAGLALMRARSAQVSPPDQLRAVYVRPSDAELNERCRE